MRIAIDLQSCQSGSRLGGIGRYSLELAKAMIRNAKNHEFWIVLNNIIPTTEAAIRHEFADLVPQDRIRVFELPSGMAHIGNHKAKSHAGELIREDFLKGIDPDFVHITSLFEGLHEDVVTSVGKLFPAEKTLITLYDLIPLVYKDKYLASKESLDHYMEKIEHLKQAGLLLSISEFSRNEAIELLDLDSNRVVNISSAADERFKPIIIESSKASQLKVNYGIKAKYIMYTGSFDQRKNHENLIRGFGLIPKKIRKNCQLFIVGNGWDAIYKDLRNLALKVGLEENDVLFAGHVKDDELLLLYNLCDLFVFPSLAEGFGLPVLEAMSCGTPTICSNCTSLPEVIGRSEAQFDPRNPESIAHAIQKVLSDESFMNLLRQDGLKQAKKFSWDLSAKKAIKAIEHHHEILTSNKFFNNNDKELSAKKIHSAHKDVVDEIAEIDNIRELSARQLNEIAECISLNKLQAATTSQIVSGSFSSMHVGMITTWNTRCGIASYSRYISSNLPAKQTIFAPYADWTVQADESNVFRCWQSGSQDELTKLYINIQASNLDVVLIQFNYGFFDFSALQNFLQRLFDLDIKVFITFHSTHDPTEDKKLSSLANVFSLCTGLFLHTLNDVNKFRGMGLTNVMFLPQGVIEVDPVPQESIVTERGYKIATYGFALPNKGLLEIVDAIDELTQKETKNYQLMMLNAEYPVQESADLIAHITYKIHQRGLSNRISVVSDYLTDHQTIACLRQSDLIVYAYPNTGESSSAAVRMGIAAGKPVAVTPINIFDDVESVVYRLSGCSASDIAEGIKYILKEIKEETLRAKTIEDSAELWRYAHGYASIARHMFWLFSKPKCKEICYQKIKNYELNAESKSTFFDARLSPLKTQVGVISTTGVKTKCQAGALIYGPFLSVAAGKYRVKVMGKFDAQPNAYAKFDVAIDGGTNVVAESLILEQNNGLLLADLIFEISSPGCNDLETRVIVNESANLEIFEIEISPHK